MRNKRRIVTLVAVLGFLLITAGVTYAFFSYIGSGSTENTISSDSITFLYEEIDQQGNGIGITDAIPVDDTTGEQGQAFNFRIISTASNTISIPYEIDVRKKDGSDNLDNIVKIYLTKVDENNQETEVELSKYSDLTTVTKNNHQEKQLHIDRVPPTTGGYIQKYRLRMWIDENTDFSNGNYNDKTFSVTVNVYSSGQVVTEQDREAASRADINSLSVNNTILSATSANQYNMSLAYGTTNTTIAVTPTNPYTIVMIDKTDSTYTNVISMGTDIQKPSTSKDVSLDNGPNYFRIKLKSEIGNNEREVHLKITVEKQTGFFATDGTVINWDTLVNTYGLANDLINGTSVLNTINKQGKLVLPNSVTRIESSSFKNCTKLTEIDISSSVTAIGIDAFRGCTNLTRIEIPDNVTSIENAAFRECTNLTSIVLPNNLSSISSGLFFGDNKLNSVIIPNSVTTIGEDAFRNCTGLTSINLPNSITTISKDAFQQSGLVSLTIPRSVTRIERFACLYCNSLTSVVFEDKNNWTHNGQTIDVSNSSTNANKFKNDGYTYPLIKTN